MNIETSKLNSTQQNQKIQKPQQQESECSFKDELKEISENNSEKNKVAETKDEKKDIKSEEKVEIEKNINTYNENRKDSPDCEFSKIADNMNTMFQEMNQKTLNQSEYNSESLIKLPSTNDDNNEKGSELINNDFNIQDNKEILPQMSPNMNFSGDGQPFSSFMNNEEKHSANSQKLALNATDLAEEAEILSTMAENIAIANKNNIFVQKDGNIKNPTQGINPLAEAVLPEVEEKVVQREDGIKKIDVQSGITIETVVKYDSVIMNEADVEVFVNIVEKGEVNLDNLAPKAAEKSVQVSKTLADMLAKCKESNQPLRIDFDNNISIIIRISRDGKISADFLPSSQIAEAYLKENLPLLRQKFDDNNIKYDELNQRERRDNQKENNRKKGRTDE